MTDNPLELIPTDDLLDEVFHRFDNVGFTGAKRNSTSSFDYEVRWYGDSHTVVGLAADLQRAVLDQLAEERKTTEENP